MSVILSIGRHEDYYRWKQLPLSNLGIARAWLTAPLIAKAYGVPQRIYSSPVNRAMNTAKVRQKSWQVKEIFSAKELSEDAGFMEAEGFKYQIMEQAEKNNLQHLHLVTHEPVAATLADGYHLQMGDVIIQQAESWSDLSAGRYKQTLFSPAKTIDRIELEKAMLRVNNSLAKF